MVGGWAIRIVNVEAAEVPAVVVTVTVAVPAVAIRLGETVALSCVALTNVVVSAAPFQFPPAPDTKFVPFTVSVNRAPPALAEAGLRLEIVSGLATIVVG